MRETVDAIVNESVRALFGTQGVALLPAAGCGAFSVVAVVGFAGSHLRGSLGLGVHGVGELVGADDIEDWAAEMANQLLGRISNRFAERGIEVDLAAPMVMRGVELRVKQGSSGVFAYPFQTGGGEVCVWLDVRPLGNLSSLETPAHSQRAVAEGDVCLF